MAAYEIFHLPRATVIDSSVRVVPGAKLYFYESTTVTPQDTYTDAALTTPHTNPVVADANGVFATIYLNPTLIYKATLTTSADVLIYTQDPANDQFLSQAVIGAFLYPRTAAEIAAGVTPINKAYPPGDIRRYGAVLDGSTSDHSAFQLADSQSAAGGAPIFVPCSASGMATDTALTVDYRSDLEFERGAYILYTGTSNIAVITIGDLTNSAFSRRYERLLVRRTNQADWTSESAIGIRLCVIAGSHIDIAESSSHTIGVQTLPGNALGFQGNNVFLGHLYNNKYQLDLSNVTVGFTNDNTFYGGRMQLFTGVNSSMSRYGIRITSADGSYTTNNANRFYGTLIELNAQDTSQEAVAIWVDHGDDNHFLDIRSESNDLGLRASNDSIRNVVEFGYSDATTTLMEQLSTASENIALGMRSRPNKFYTLPVLQISDLGRKARGTSGTSILVEGLMWGTSGGGASFTAVSGTSITYDGNYITVGTTRCMGVFVETASAKEFVVRRSGTAGGRVRVVAFDTAGGTGSILSATGSVLGTRSAPMTYDGSLFGGSWGYGGDFLTDAYFRVSQSTQSVFVLFTGGTASAALSSVGIYALCSANGVRAFTGSYTTAGEIVPAYTTGAHATLRDFTGTTTAAQALQLLETLVDDLKTQRVLR